MIVRQTFARHGRSALHASRRQFLHRQYATETSIPEASKMLASIEKEAKELEDRGREIQTQIYSKISERLSSALELHETGPPSNILTATVVQQMDPEEQFTNKRDFDKRRQEQIKSSAVGSSLLVAYDSKLALKNLPKAADLTLPMLMASQTHLGHATSLWNPRNSSYIFGIRDGIHIISLDATYAYLRRAAKVVQEVARRGGMILFVGTRDKQEEIVVKAAAMARGYHVFDRWVPGSLTNGQQILGHCQLKVVNVTDKELPKYSALLGGPSGHPVLKPDLVVCFNPLENEVCLHECGLHNVPTVGVIDTDADASWVTYPIPANDDSIRSITLIAGVLGHAGAEGQRLRLEQAKTGRATYSTKAVEYSLANLEDMNALRMEERAGGSRDE